MRRVIIEQRPWAVGLQWVTGTAKPTIAELRQDASKIDPTLDMVAYRQRQHGFAASGGAVRSWLGVRALAAAVRVTSPSFLGLFCLEDQQEGTFWWVYAVSQALIVGMGDQVFAARAEAEEWIQSLKGLLVTDFEEIVVCETVEDSLRWLTPLISTGPFGRIRSRTGSLQPLRPVPGQRGRLIVMGSIAGTLLFGGYGLKLFLAHRAGQQAMEAARVAMINKEQRKKELQAHPERYFPQPWVKAPEVGDLVPRGISALLELPTAASGWTLDRAAYDGKAVVATWGHKSGADYVHLPFAAHLETPQKAVSRLPLAGPFNPRLARPLLSREQCTRMLYDGTQVLGARLRLSYSVPEKKRVENVEVTAPWARGQWELSEIPSAMMLDGGLPEIFTRIPGLILETLALEKTIWVIKGSVYVTAN
ncbi:Pilin accessory family protein [Solidesulfovibrio carbinoliphilus subsp. oakridgensis]|uniref:Pilin accessory family protein n=1 Tax=Solidesulfovibrio carbinoliphilus subsp. oakridgensis TaxID=694327 RepID=G7QB70_9BACT|nr:type 4b pilus protein PilO2 [Solidesulfovibrio carbinoliphilus]EHJ48812.1 Pilin accessory family protein [Solidesulfovibrio carbinoliphilus subsp. oakridgensis]